MPMDDREEPFDRFLAEALSPAHGEPDQQFVARMRQQIRLDEMLRARRGGILERLGIELLSLVALGCGLLAIGSSADVADFAREVPHMALIAVMLIFAAWVPLVAVPARRRDWS